MDEKADQKITAFLTDNGYHPRSSRHGDAICNFFLQDLIRDCPSFREAASSGKVVYQLNYTIDPASPSQWNADLVIGPPGAPVTTQGIPGLIVRGNPSQIWIAIDAKTIMTEHGKARRNRQRDLNSFQDLLHRKDSKTIVGGLLLINIAPKFQTPLHRASGPVTIHKNLNRLVEEIIVMMNELPRAGSSDTRSGLEGLGAIVVSHTNVSGETSLLVTAPPAPGIGHPLNYITFLKDICTAFGKRFG